MVTLTREQEIQLSRHAAALQLTPPEALAYLLNLPPITPGAARRPWSDHELDLVRNPANSPRSIARYTGRSITAVSNKRHQLARAEGITALQYRPRAASKTDMSQPGT